MSLQRRLLDLALKLDLSQDFSLHKLAFCVCLCAGDTFKTLENVFAEYRCGQCRLKSSSSVSKESWHANESAMASAI